MPAPLGVGNGHLAALPAALGHLDPLFISVAVSPREPISPTEHLELWCLVNMFLKV
jgi:hypothetical protein